MEDRMRLHLEKETFSEAILATAEHFKINEVFVEKDYWVTLVLKNLSQSKFKNRVVFKGGTSLSKAYKLISRFSEDIDLAIIPEAGTSGNEVKQLIRDIEKGITKGLSSIETPGVTSKGSKFRKTVFEYPRILLGGSFGQASDKLLVEINSFASPHPYREMVIQSMIANFLSLTDRKDVIESQGLNNFRVNVLGLERTLTEKVLSLVRASYSENSLSELSAKIRHLYDLHFIVNQQAMRDFVSGDGFKKMIRKVLADDQKNSQFQGEWTKIPLPESPFFADWENIWKQLQATYQNEFKSLVFSELPDSKAIDASIRFIGQFIK
jgi:predicted nucleotidyltransferase component of viral defense system